MLYKSISYDIRKNRLGERKRFVITSYRLFNLIPLYVVTIQLEQ